MIKHWVQIYLVAKNFNNAFSKTIECELIDLVWVLHLGTKYLIKQETNDVEQKGQGDQSILLNRSLLQMN